jgi:crotonobetainyl-CoA:carnitine CoA-transferase CaiB-like acyl-CoA transferase
MQDSHFKARNLFHQVEIDGKPLKLPALAPRLNDTPGNTTWPGLAVGSHNRLILGDFLGLQASEIDALQREGII